MSDTSTAQLRQQLLTNAPQLTVEDAAHYLRTDADTITHLLEERQLPGYRLPDRWLIAADELAGEIAGPSLAADEAEHGALVGNAQQVTDLG